MSVKDSLWKIEIPYRIWAYATLDVGFILSILSIIFHPYEYIILAIGITMIMLSTSYLCAIVFKAGFRRQAILLFLLILMLCAVPIGLIMYYESLNTNF